MAKLLKTPVILFFLLLICLLQTIFLSSVLHLPPIGQHVWRQVTGLAFAKNFAFEQAPFFFPRQDIRVSLADTGTIYHEFPLIYWLVGKAWQSFGFDHFYARSIALCANFLGVLASYVFAHGLYQNERRTLIFCFLYSLAPLSFYYATTLLPDLFAMHNFLLGTGLLLLNRRHGGYGWRFWSGLLFVLLALVTKPSWALYGLPVAWILIEPFLDSPRRLLGKPILALGCGTLLVMIPFLLQLKHSQTLFNASPIERAVHAQLKIAEFPQNFADISRNVSTGFGNWFIEMNVSWGAMIFFIAGLVCVFRSLKGGSFSRKFWIAYAASFGIYTLLFLMRFGDHDYYLTSSLPLAVALSSLGAAWLLEKKRFAWLVIVLLSAYPFLSWQRVKGRWSNPQVPTALLEESAAFRSHIPENDGVLIVGDKTPLVYLYYLDRKGMVYLPNVGDAFEQRITDPFFGWLLFNTKGPVNIPETLLASHDLEMVESRGDIQLFRMRLKPSEGGTP